MPWRQDYSLKDIIVSYSQVSASLNSIAGITFDWCKLNDPLNYKLGCIDSTNLRYYARMGKGASYPAFNPFDWTTKIYFEDLEAIEKADNINRFTNSHILNVQTFQRNDNS